MDLNRQNGPTPNVMDFVRCQGVLPPPVFVKFRPTHDARKRQTTSKSRHIQVKDDFKGEGSFQQYVEFLSKYKWLETLELKDCRWSWRNGNSSATMIDLPTLKRLKIFQTIHTEPAGAKSWERFLTFQNLEALSLEYRAPTSHMSDIEDILDAAKSIKDGAGMPLKELEIIDVPKDSKSWNGEFLKTIADCSFPLENLKIDVKIYGKMEVNGAIQSILRILVSCNESLQYLQTTFNFDLNKNDFPDRDVFGGEENLRSLVTMNALKEVKVGNWLWGFILLSNLELPNLKKLVLDYGNRKTEMEIQNYLDRLLKCKLFGEVDTLEVLCNQYQGPSKASIALFAKMMPKLVHLTVPADRKSFRKICTLLGCLKTLNIQAIQHGPPPHFDVDHAPLDDESLTGVGVTKRAQKQGPSGPNITDLVNLEHLTISGNAVFTSHAATYGFLHLPKLKFLSVAFKKISDEAREKLMKHVEDLQIYGKQKPNSKRRALTGFQKLQSKKPKVVSMEMFQLHLKQLSMREKQKARLYSLGKNESLRLAGIKTASEEDNEHENNGFNYDDMAEEGHDYDAIYREGADYQGAVDERELYFW